MPNDFTIKLATADDVPLVLSFIKKHADYHGILDEVTVTEEILRDTLFCARPFAEVIIGYLNNKPVSYAVFFYIYQPLSGGAGLYMEDLYVDAEARAQGLGERMIAYLAKLAQERKCTLFEWWVYDWNTKALKFYKHLGAKPMEEEEWTIFLVTGEPLNRLAATWNDELTADA